MKLLGTMLDASNEAIDIANENAPLILTVTGIGIGVVSLGLCGVASYHAADIIKNVKNDPTLDTTGKKVLAIAKDCIPLFVPVAITAAGAIVCLVKSYDISAKRIATATALAEVSLTTLEMYKKKAKSMIGEEKLKELEKEVREEQKKEDDAKREAGEPTPFGNDIHWFRDELTQQEFLSTDANMVRANLDLIIRLDSEMMVSVNEWIDTINDYVANCGDDYYKLQHPLDGDDRGWEQGYPIYLSFDKGGKTRNGMPCTIIQYSLPPKPGYRRRYY